jgi:menaquinone-dependent protoporphyrinogen oxidase
MSGKKILIVYATTDGQTAKVARRIADVAASVPGVHAVPRDIAEGPPPDLQSADLVVVAASVRFGKHQRAAARFVRANRDLLSKKHSAFVSVSGASANPDGRSEAEKYALDFLCKTHWTPDCMELVASAVRFTQYNPLLRFVMRRIAASRGMSTDTTRDYEHTDWNALDQFTRSLLPLLEAKVA